MVGPLRRRRVHGGSRPAGASYYIWLYMILAVFSPNEVQVWEGLLTLAFFPISRAPCLGGGQATALLEFMHKYTLTNTGVIIETEAERSRD
ncbi:sodium/calcium exchanger 3 isoform X1 [Lates japonicus]|uniref:Sodium/calcium exchanger 3 isoform X1 n=1 Tax=Lates japonicus TaxID=270547 RepID=A0AAD3RJ52_LATJO|nr:sodium/calcium exchanger 3 isoform X1 [Lates japonicus]